MTWKDEIIHLSSVDIEDHSFRITTEENIESLSCSIRNAGLINHPIVIRKKSGYAVISGFRRIRSALNLGWTNISARTIKSDTGRFECAKLAIADNSLQRQLNLIEISRCYKLLSESFKGVDLLGEASMIGLPGNPALAEKIMRLVDLPPVIQNCVISETVSLAMALELGGIEHETGIALADIFDKLKPSLNKQREILSLSSEIAARENIPVADLIKGNDFINIISDENTDKNRKILRIRHYLKARRFPAIMKAEDNFRRNVKKLALTGGIKLIPPADFEGNIFIISMEFKTTSELGEMTACLNRLTKDPVLDEIVSKSLYDLYK
jgi:ParB/RepB/Spo0J family partition protein